MEEKVGDLLWHMRLIQVSLLLTPIGPCRDSGLALPDLFENKAGA